MTSRCIKLLLEFQSAGGRLNCDSRNINPAVKKLAESVHGGGTVVDGLPNGGSFDFRSLSNKKGSHRIYNNGLVGQKEIPGSTPDQTTGGAAGDKIARKLFPYRPSPVPPQMASNAVTPASNPFSRLSGSPVVDLCDREDEDSENHPPSEHDVTAGWHIRLVDQSLATTIGGGSPTGIKRAQKRLRALNDTSKAGLNAMIINRAFVLASKETPDPASPDIAKIYDAGMGLDDA